METDALVPSDEPDILTGCGATLPCDPRRRMHRYLMLFFICFLSFGSYFCYDNPSALQETMLHTLGITEIQFMNLYAFYSWPNVVLSFVGGFLLDRVFGVAVGAILFASICCVGQLLLGLGAYLDSIYLMYFARFVFGIGGESLCVAANTYTTGWFPSSELNFVFGLQLSMSRVGSTVNMLVMQPLFEGVGSVTGLTEYRQLGATLLVAGLTCVYSVVCAGILAYFHRRANRINDAWQARIRSTASGQLDSSENADEPSSDAEQKITMKDVVTFPGAIWLICVVCVAYYVAVFPFISLGIIFFERKFDYDIAHASSVNSLVYIVSAIASPFFGAAIDFTGRNLFWLSGGVIITLLCHLTFALSAATVIPPVVVMVIFGMAYSILASSLWPMVAFLLPSYQRGTAYGLIQSVQNLGLGSIAVFTGYLVDAKGYLFLELFFILCLCLALAGVFGLFLWDQANDNRLNESAKRRRERCGSKRIVVDADSDSPLPVQSVESTTTI